MQEDSVFPKVLVPTCPSIRDDCVVADLPFLQPIVMLDGTMTNIMYGHETYDSLTVRGYKYVVFGARQVFRYSNSTGKPRPIYCHPAPC
jgi:hypothetical protein